MAADNWWQDYRARRLDPHREQAAQLQAVRDPLAEHYKATHYPQPAPGQLRQLDLAEEDAYRDQHPGFEAEAQKEAE